MPTVADLIVEGLCKAGVARLFAATAGGAHREVLEAARAQRVAVVGCHREAAAVVMAAVSSELTGEPGAVLCGSGPGVSASVAGLAHALLDRAPVIFVSERRPKATLPLAAHPIADHANQLAPVVKSSLTLSADSVSHWMAHAAQLALKEPRGPVHLDLPADVPGAPALPLAANPRPPAPLPPDVELLDRAGAMIRGARRPLVVAGLECRRPDAPWLRAFCEAIPAPVLATIKAKGAIPDPHPLAMGTFTGARGEDALMRRADLIIAFGLDPVELRGQPWRYDAPIPRLPRCAWAE